MSFSIGNILDKVADIAEMISPIISLINPVAGAALNMGANALESAKNQDWITGGALSAIAQQGINGRPL